MAALMAMVIRLAVFVCIFDCGGAGGERYCDEKRREESNKYKDII